MSDVDRLAIDAALDAVPRLRLAHLPTPLLKVPRLDARLGCDLWVKRDDGNGGAEAGNKLRKLEMLLADAIARGCDTVLTCGGVQSNHARATALLCARLGLHCVLFLRVADVGEPLPLSGNALIDRLAGAEVRKITADEYRDRRALMAEATRALRVAGRKPYVIPEGGSNGLGALGYVNAMREVRSQLDVGLGGGRPFDVVVTACGSGGTAAGLAIGAASYDVAKRALAFAVSDDAAFFTRVIASIIAEACAIVPGLPRDARFDVDDRSRGPAYGVSTIEQRRWIAEVASVAGLALDPVYTGKAMSGLVASIARGDIAVGSRVLFVHTGGVPGLLADGHTFADVV